MTTEQVGLKVEVHWKLEKYDGEFPVEGETKLPVEILEGNIAQKELPDGLN